ncbi:amidase [Candidatus Bathyarchaeota archaeon]|nr:amidase [Candidatus Bathyarchaeota archaeon]
MPRSLVYATIRELSLLIRDGRVTPVELAELFLERLEELGPKYNAVVTVTRIRALEEARRAEREIEAGEYRGPLHGIPYGVKDLLATTGIPTTWGASPFRDQLFDYDAAVVERLRDAGAVLAAKLAMIELAGGMGYRQPNASFTGPPRNPWNPDYWAGGSSSGSAAAVCAGLTPFSIGSETWGSILSPANNCGVSGLRPTYGRVSRYGAMTLSWTLDKLGPFCLTADDCGIVLEAISGFDPRDPSTVEKPFKYDDKTPRRRFKLAYIGGVTEGVDEDVLANFERSLRELKKVASIEEITLPELPYEAVTRTILYAESASAFEEFIESGRASELTAPEDRYGAYARMTLLARDYLRAMRIRMIISRAVDEAMAPYDALIAPSRPAPATPIDREFRGVVSGAVRDLMGAIGNCAGLPAISVPNGFTDEGLPTGIQFMGRAYEENKILAVARAYQSLTDWHKHHPPGLDPND